MVNSLDSTATPGQRPPRPPLTRHRFLLMLIGAIGGALIALIGAVLLQSSTVYAGVALCAGAIGVGLRIPPVPPSEP